MIKYDYIEPFNLENIEFLGAYCYKYGDKSLLLSNQGTSIILSNKLVAEILNHELSENLSIKLYQRGFVKLFDKERFIENEDNLPTFFMIDFTTKCNLNCIYCLRHFENEGKSIDKKSLDDICDYIISYCKKHKINNISFQPWGGEPLIEIDKIIDSKKRFEDAGINVDYTVQTNGLLLSKENYIKLQENGIGFGISLDGNKEVHDSHRVDLKGNKTFDNLINRLEDIRKIDPECKFSTLSVNSMYTLEHIEESVRYLVEEQGIEFLKFNLVHPNGEDFDWNMLIKKKIWKSLQQNCLMQLLTKIRKDMLLQRRI